MLKFFSEKSEEIRPQSLFFAPEQKRRIPAFKECKPKVPRRVS